MDGDETVCCASLLEPKDVNKKGIDTEKQRDIVNNDMNEQSGTDLTFEAEN